MIIKVTEDTSLANQVRAMLKANDGYCPCKTLKNEDTRCLCKEFRQQGLGECHCGLYKKIEI